MTAKSDMLSRDFIKALAKRGCTYSEIWDALTEVISFLIAGLPEETRQKAYHDLIVRCEKVITENAAAGLKGAPISRRH